MKQNKQQSKKNNIRVAKSDNIRTNREHLLNEFLKFTELSVKKDPWIKDEHLQSYCRYLIEEAHEVLSALEKNDTENLKEELGDILSLWAILCSLAEDKKLFTADDVVTDAIAKIKRRRPYILDPNAKQITKEESHKIWMQVKAQEQEAKTKKK